MPAMRLIAGSGRSGTTWVLDALAAANQLRPVFEPLNPYASKIGSQYAHRALAPGDQHPELRKFFEDVCAGHRERLWTQYRRQWRWLFPPPARVKTLAGVSLLRRRWVKFVAEAPALAMMATKRDPIVKCIWSNLMLSWLAKQFDCQIVLIVRHPGAVIESELRNDWDAKFALERFRTDDRLHELTNGRYSELLGRQLTPVEGLTVRWLIENQPIIETAPAGGVTIVHYERLRSSADLAWEQIRKLFELQRTPDAAILARPSQQSFERKAAVDAHDARQPRWQRELTSEQMSQIQNVLDKSSFELYSVNDPNPRDLLYGATQAGAVDVAR